MDHPNVTHDRNRDTLHFELKDKEQFILIRNMHLKCNNEKYEKQKY